jgi:hypothetical protein
VGVRVTLDGQLLDAFDRGVARFELDLRSARAIASCCWWRCCMPGVTSSRCDRCSFDNALRPDRACSGRRRSRWRRG